ncbi:MAG: hypothetical protein AAF638_06560 [Pseudomonadota bacterium]
MMLRVSFMAGWLIFVAACSEQIGPSSDAAPQAPDAEAPSEPTLQAAPDPVPFVQAERASVTLGDAAIDWDAARTDLASSGDTTAMASGFQIQSGAEAPPVPVLLPTGIVTTQSVPGEAPRFREMADGYFARYPGIDYDITVSGSNEVFDVPGDGAIQEDAARFQTTVSGVMVSLQRYGADYMVEFECNNVSGDVGNSCINEEDALDVARNLVIVGSR